MLKEFNYNNDKYISKNEWLEFSKIMAEYANHGLIAVQLGESGNVTLKSSLWKETENVPETPSVIVKNGLVYMTKNGGTATCVNAHNGEVVYSEKLGASGSYMASPLLANGLLYIPSFKGEITIVKEGKEFEIVNQIDLDERIGASPAALKDKLYVRTASTLYAFK